jgi:hypothetical protein
MIAEIARLQQLFLNAYFAPQNSASKLIFKPIILINFLITIEFLRPVPNLLIECINQRLLF